MLLYEKYTEYWDFLCFLSPLPDYHYYKIIYIGSNVQY